MIICGGNDASSKVIENLEASEKAVHGTENPLSSNFDFFVIPIHFTPVDVMALMRPRVVSVWSSTHSILVRGITSPSKSIRRLQIALTHVDK